MKVLFIQKDFYPALGVLSLASVVRKEGHVCDLVITDIENLKGKLLEFKPDVVALSFTSGLLPWARNIARTVKESLGSRIQVIIGGAHPTFYPEVVQEENFDIACRGEAEEYFPLLLKALEEEEPIGSIPNLAYLRKSRLHISSQGPPPDVKRLPFPAYDLLVKYNIYPRMGSLTLLTNRGCPFDCTFCHIPAVRRLVYNGKGSAYRRMSPKAVIELIKYGRHIYPKIRFIRFEDDTFNALPESWMDEFCRSYKKHVSLPFECQLRLDLVTEESADFLKAAGCKSVKVGIETADDTIRNEVYNKRLSREDIVEGVQILKKRDILVEGLNVIGAPMETIEQALETYAFNLELGVDAADSANLYPYPGTSLAKKQLNRNTAYYYQTNPNGNAHFENLVQLFAWGVYLRIPKSIMRNAISVPRNAVYRILYWFGQILIKLRMRTLGAGNLLMMLSYSIGFFNILPGREKA